MSFKANYKIKKSKFLFSPPSDNNKSQEHPFEEKQKKVCQMTFRSITNSHGKYKTINYKEYDSERKAQMQKRKKLDKPLSLYLDGNNPPFKLSLSESPKKSPSHAQESQYSFLKAIDIMPKQTKQINSSRKALKNILLKQIQNKKKSKQSASKILPSDQISFQAVEQLFVLKKINKMARDHKAQRNNKKINENFKFRNLSFRNQRNEAKISMSSNFSILSERSFSKSKVLPLNQQTHLSQILLPSVGQKNNFRPLVMLQGKQAKKIQAQSYIVVKYPEFKVISGQSYKKNAEIASLTKIMTFYTILLICKQYSIDQKNRVIQICQTAQQISGTSAQIFSGQKYTLEQLFYGLMLPSGNDAAVAIAKEGGSILKTNKNKKIDLQEDDIKCFVRYMNILAKNIGMKTSNFCNPHGLPHPQSSSNPLQLSLLLSECLKIKQFLKVTGTKTYSFWTSSPSNKREVLWENTHKLLRRSGFIGGKTGVTITAGPCLASIYQTKNNQIFIVVVLRATKLSRRFKQTRWILGLSLKGLDNKIYANDSKQILKPNPDLDSDNSQDQQAFDFKKSDSIQMRKRNKILLYQL